VKVCKFDAIHIVDGKAVVDVEKCVNCGACKAACPRKLIETAPADQKVFVNCASKAKGQDVRKQCSIGCIGCTLCTRKCPTGAITVENNLASIDYSKCINCGACAEACPRKLIVNLGAKPEVAEEVAAQ
jgi:formate hydrogenlyase subunit 6/NADH:ubiquinone oxidoreductase subunit I